MVVFDHEKLDVYKLGAEFADLAEEIAQSLGTGHGHIKEQLRRSSDSLINNIAEGAGEFLPAEKARFYRMALRSGTESAASLHTCLRRTIGDQEKIERARIVLKGVVEMLTKLIAAMGKRLRSEGTGTGTGTRTG